MIPGNANDPRWRTVRSGRPRMRATWVALLAAALYPLHAARADRWIATSTDAISITGNITLRDNVLIFGDGRRLSLLPAGTRESYRTPLPERRQGVIYRLDPPSDPVLLNGNTLCGMPVSFIVLTQLSTHDLSISVFTGAKPPLRFGDHSCAAYFYER